MSTTPGALAADFKRRRPNAKRLLRRSMVADEQYAALEKSAIKAFGPDTGARWVADVRAGEHDIAVASQALLGVLPWPWQVAVWEGLQERPFGTVMLGNGSGKTASFGIYYPVCATYRRWAPEWWGLYRMLHHGPQETHALQVKIKLDEWLRGRGREQAYQARRPDGTMGWLYRPAPISLFTEAVKHDNGQHWGYDFFGGSASLTFRSTAFKAQGSDGTDPHIIGEDELRYETDLTHVVEAVYIPRTFRAADMRLYLPCTNLEAGVDFLMLFERGASGKNKYWFALNLALDEANPTVTKEQHAKVRDNVSRRRIEQITSGKPIQPLGAKYSMEAIRASYTGGELERLDDLGRGVCDTEKTGCDSCRFKRQFRGDDVPPLMAWLQSRCDICKAGREQLEHGEPVTAVHPESGESRHPAIGAIDPSSSGTKDSIVCSAWDLHPPKEVRDRGFKAECVYVEELEPGTRIQHVARHAVNMSLHLTGEMGYDFNGPLGHAVSDLSVEIDDSAELVPVEWNTKQQKDKSLDWYKAVLEHNAVLYHDHLQTRAQTTNYIRENDRKLKTDFLMTQVYCAEMARSYLPDFWAEKVDERSEPDVEEEARGYIGLGMGAYDAYSPAAPGEEDSVAPDEVTI